MLVEEALEEEEFGWAWLIHGGGYLGGYGGFVNLGMVGFGYVRWDGDLGLGIGWFPTTSFGR